MALSCLQFDGTASPDQYATFSMPAMGAAGCIEVCWVWSSLPGTSSPTQAIILTGALSDIRFDYSPSIGVDNDGVVIRHIAYWVDDGGIKSITGLIGAQSAQTDVLYRYTMAWSSGTMRFLVSTVNLSTGVTTTTTIGTAAITGSIRASDEMYLGKEFGDALPDLMGGSGKMLDVRVYTSDPGDSLINSRAFVRLAGTESGLARYYWLREGTGTSIDDRTSNNVAGTITNATWSTLSVTLNPFELSPGRMKGLTGLKRQSVLGASRYAIYPRFKVTNGAGTEIDYTTYMVRARWTESIDQPVISATVELTREGAGGGNLSPLVEGSALNTDGLGGFAPALHPARDCSMEVAVVAAGASPAESDYVLMWNGRVDRVDWSNEDAITLTIRDVGGWLQQAFIRDETTYSDDQTSVTDLMQNILDDWPASALREIPTLVEVDDPDWFLDEHVQQPMRVLDALMALAQQIGFDLRYEYTEDDPFVLRLAEPARTSTTADTEWGPTLYTEVPVAEMDDELVRTIVRLVWEDENGVIHTQTQIDVEGQIEFGDVFMQIAGPAVAAINTEDEAGRFLEAVASDVSTPEFSHAYRFRFNPFVMLNDIYDFTTNSVHYDTTQTGAVQQIEHVLEGGGGWTTIHVSGRPRGGYRTWLGKEDDRELPDILSLGATHSSGTITVTATFSEAVKSWSLWARNGSSPLSSGTPSDTYLASSNLPPTTGSVALSNCEDGTWYLVLRSKDKDDRISQRTATCVVSGQGGGTGGGGGGGGGTAPDTAPPAPIVSESTVTGGGTQFALASWVNTNSVDAIDVEWYADGALFDIVNKSAGVESDSYEFTVPPLTRVRARVRYTNGGGDGPWSLFSNEVKLYGVA